MGIGIVPQEIIHGRLGLGTLVAIPLNKSWARRTLMLGVRNLGSLPPATRLLVDHLLASQPAAALRPCRRLSEGLRRGAIAGRDGALSKHDCRKCGASRKLTKLHFSPQGRVSDETPEKGAYVAGTAGKTQAKKGDYPWLRIITRRTILSVTGAVAGGFTLRRGAPGLRSSSPRATFTRRPRLPILSHYVADRQGFFKDAGLDCKLIQGGSGVKMREIVASGQGDIGIGDMSHPMQLSNHGRTARILMPVDIRNSSVGVHPATTRLAAARR